MRNKLLLLAAAGVLAVLVLASSPASSLGACTPPYCPSYTLMVVKAGSGSGTVTSSPAGINCGSTCSSNYDEGTKVTLTATAAPGSTFAGWTGGGGCSGTGTCVATVKVHTTVTAIFNAKPPSRPHVTIDVKPKASNGSAKAIIKVPAPGKIKIWGKAIPVVRIDAKHKGTYKRTLRAKGRVKRHLDNRGWTRRKQIFVLYVSKSGDKAKAKRTVRFHTKLK
jgi:hypothetical protein